MNHINTPWAPIQQANGVSCLHPTIVSDTGPVLTVAWQGDVPSTNRLIEQLCAVPELVAALTQVRDVLALHPDAHQGNKLVHFAYMSAINALAKLEG